MSGSEDQVRQWGEMLADSLRSLPWSAHGVVLLALIGGVVLWLFGSRSVRTGFTLIGVIGGGVLGAFVPAAFGLELDPALGAAIGAVAGLICGLTLFRVVTALAMGAALAVFAPLLAAVVMEFTGPPGIAARSDDSGHLDSGALFLEDVPRVEDFDHAMETAGHLSPLMGDEARDGVEVIRSSSQKLREFFQQLGEQIRPLWEELPQAKRVTLVGSAILGLLAGALVGALLPKKAAAVITALAGAALILPSAIWLLSAAGAGIERTLPTRPLGWLAAWAGLAVIGTVVQWRMGSARRADNR